MLNETCLLSLCALQEQNNATASTNAEADADAALLRNANVA